MYICKCTCLTVMTGETNTAFEEQRSRLERPLRNRWEVIGGIVVSSYFIFFWVVPRRSLVFFFFFFVSSYIFDMWLGVLEVRSGGLLPNEHGEGFNRAVIIIDCQLSRDKQVVVYCNIRYYLKQL